MREICTSGSAGGPGGVIPWGYPTVSSQLESLQTLDLVDP